MGVTSLSIISSVSSYLVVDCRLTTLIAGFGCASLFLSESTLLELRSTTSLVRFLDFYLRPVSGGDFDLDFDRLTSSDSSSEPSNPNSASRSSSLRLISVNMFSSLTLRDFASLVTLSRLFLCYLKSSFIDFSCFSRFLSAGFSLKDSVILWKFSSLVNFIYLMVASRVSRLPLKRKTRSLQSVISSISFFLNSTI